jgi:hypothetical protein
LVTFRSFGDKSLPLVTFVKYSNPHRVATKKQVERLSSPQPMTARPRRSGFRLIEPETEQISRTDTQTETATNQTSLQKLSMTSSLWVTSTAPSI